MRSAVGSQGAVHGLDALQKRHEAGQTLPTLLCDGRNCGVPVRFVPAHTQRGTDRHAVVELPAYITLDNGAEHAPGCRYNAPGRLAAVLASVSDAGVVQALDDGRHELRLLGLHQALKRGATDARLDGDLHTLTDLLAVRAMCGSDDLIASQVVLRLGKKKVAWENFFYDQERYDAAWHRLDAASNDVPLALVGTVRSHRAAQGEAGQGSTFLNCAPKYQQSGVVDRREFVEVSVGHDDAAWLKTFPVGAEIVMVGLWRHGRTSTSTRPHPTDPRRTITNVTYKLSLRPSSRFQLAAVY